MLIVDSDVEFEDIFFINVFVFICFVCIVFFYMWCIGVGVIFNVVGIGGFSGSLNVGVYCFFKVVLVMFIEVL